MFAQAFSVLCLIIFQVAASSYHSQSSFSTGDECPTGVYIIGVRATTEEQGFGAMEVIVDQLLDMLPGSDAYAIVYPAKGIIFEFPWVKPAAYKASEAAGVFNLTAEIVRFTDACPHNGIVLMGYSQGAQVVGDVLCGRTEDGFDPSPAIDDKYKAQIKAIVQLGDPSNRADIPWHVGNSTTGGFFPRRSLANCTAQGSLWQSYCDKGDPFCARGEELKVHLHYVKEYDNNITNFIVAKVGTSQSHVSEHDMGEFEL